MSSPSPRSDDEEDDDLPEELDRRAEEALEDDEFISFDEHVENRDA